MTVVGFVGAGQLGLPMVGRLLAAGHEVVVHARRPEVREALDRLGARAVARAEEAAEGAQVLLACLFSDEQLEQVAPRVLEALPAGAVFASHVTGTAGTLRRLADRARDVAVLDAPVSGTAQDIEAGRLTVLLGGDDDRALATCHAVLRAYADPVLLTGGLGTALAVKLVNNLLFAANVQLVAAAVALGEDLGVSTAALLQAVEHCSGGSRAAAHAAAAPSLAAFAAGIAPFLAKDVAACRTAAADLGVDPALLLDVVGRGPLALAGTAGAP